MQSDAHDKIFGEKYVVISIVPKHNNQLKPNNAYILRSHRH